MRKILISIAVAPFTGFTANPEQLEAAQADVKKQFADMKMTDASVTLVYFNTKTSELCFSNDQEIGFKLPKEQKVIVKAVGDNGDIILEFDKKLKLDPMTANAIGRILELGFGEKFDFSTVATDTRYETRVAHLKRGDNKTWKAMVAKHIRSFSVDADDTYAILTQDGGLSYGISKEKAIALIDGELSFAKKKKYSVDTRLIRPPLGFTAYLYDTEDKTLQAIDYDGKETKSVKVDAILVEKMDKRDKPPKMNMLSRDGGMSRVTKIDDISQAGLPKAFVESYTAARQYATGAHKAPDQAMNAK